jgi:FAD/FMN-containing dehydrogenase/Fe-S oxidoreductase
VTKVGLPVVPPPGVDVAGLRAALAGEVRFDRLSRAIYSTDASVYQIVPLGVVLPRTEDDVAAAVRACARFGVPLTARGGGTSQAGQCIGPGVVLDCSKYLDRITAIDPAGRRARVQPGVVLDDLNRALKPHGLHFPLDISTSNRATLGGMIANNSSGTRSVVYGKTIDHVESVRAVLADGSVIHAGPLTDAEVEAKCRQDDREGEVYRTVRRLGAEHAGEIGRRYPKVLRRVGGYNLDRFTPGEPFNLAHLLVGSEGTLAVTLEATVRLAELPRARGVLVIQFGDLLEALAATPVILNHGPTAVEVIDKYVLDSTKLNAEAARLRDFLQGDPAAVLIVEVSGDDAAQLPPRLQAVESDLRGRGLGTHFLHAADAAAQGRVWKLRKLSLGLSMAEKGDAKAVSFVEDTAVSPERLRDYIAEFQEVLRSHGTRAGIYAHASVGCLHVRPVIDLKTADGVRNFEAIADAVAGLVLKYGGALSGEHGDGLVRSPFQERMFGPVLYQAFREVKKAFDPAGILNPGKIVDAPPLTNSLRYGPAYVTPDVPTTFDFAADGGVVRAAELCAGVGECRKKREGTMCPSYQATCDEQHSTRGRANALRLALTGQAGLQGLTDPALAEALDLCLECKACKSECPTNVDVARLKAEFLHQYHKKHGRPWRSWLFGNLETVSRWGSALAPVSNWLMRSGGARWLNERLFAIDHRRIPPAFVRQGFVGEFLTAYSRYLKPSQEHRGDCLVFPDCFINWYDPAVGMAAATVLSRMGFGVALGTPRGQDFSGSFIWGLRCCGRPLISNGLLTQATELARENVRRLHEAITDYKLTIVGCEPSCILTIKDDYPALLRGELRQQAEKVAAACVTFEEALECRVEGLVGSFSEPPGLPRREDGGGKPRRSPTRAAPKRVLVQGHCHQRSLVGMGPTLRLLRRIPGAEVIDLDAGCCGLAGSFGYEKEHSEVSRLVGEQRLFPAVRAADPDTVIVAPGFSCRSQIRHFTGRVAVHPAELLRDLLA